MSDKAYYIYIHIFTSTENASSRQFGNKIQNIFQQN